MVVFIHFIIAFAASIIGAISGIGGGIIIKPLLDTFGYFDIATITFLSGCTVLSMSGVSLLLIRKTEISVNRRIGGMLAISGVIGGITGKYLFNQLLQSTSKPDTLQIIQASILITLCLGVLIFTANKSKITAKNFSNFSICVITGFILGLTGAFLGIGGGPINLLVLYFFFSMDSKTAAVNSLFIIFFSQLASLMMTIVSGRIPQFNLIILLFMVGGGISGAFAGAKISLKMSHNHVDRLFMVVLVMIITLCARNIVG